MASRTETEARRELALRLAIKRWGTRTHASQLIEDARRFEDYLRDGN